VTTNLNVAGQIKAGAANTTNAVTPTGLVDLTPILAGKLSTNGSMSGLTGLTPAQIAGAGGVTNGGATINGAPLTNGASFTITGGGGSATNSPLRLRLAPGAALVYGSISNATISGTAGGNWALNTDVLLYDPTTPQIAIWQFPIQDYTGGTVVASWSWTEPIAGSKTNVWVLGTAQVTNNGALPTAPTVNLTVTQAVNATANSLTINTATITPSWTAGNSGTAWFTLKRDAADASDVAASTSFVFHVEIKQ
jgi:hypothetical protein